MATYTYDVTTDIGKVRLLIGDIDIVPTIDAQFSDEEITAFLTISGSSVFLAAAYALKSWASTLSEDVTGERIGDYSYTKKQVDNKLKLAENFEKQAAMTPAVAIASFNFTNVEETG